MHEFFRSLPQSKTLQQLARRQAQQIKICNILNDATCKFPMAYLTRGEKQDAVTWKSPTACQKTEQRFIGITRYLASR